MRSIKEGRKEGRKACIRALYSNKRYSLVVFSVHSCVHIA